MRKTTTAARACEDKIRHMTRADALAAMRSWIGNGVSPALVNVYECPIRKFGERRHWHVGHRPTTGRRP